MPSARVAGSAAGIVAEVLTTSRSPARRWAGRPRKRVVDERAAVALRDEQADLVALEPARLGRRARLVRGRERERERAAHARDSSSAPAA